MIQGLRTVIYPTPDLAQGREWYRRVLNCDPYFDEPYYIGFAVGGFELGLIPDGEPSSAGVQAYWGVANVEIELQRLIGIGAVLHEAVKNVGGDIKVASVRDPFCNVFGIIENPHFRRDSVQ